MVQGLLITGKAPRTSGHDVQVNALDHGVFEATYCAAGYTRGRGEAVPWLWCLRHVPHRKAWASLTSLAHQPAPGPEATQPEKLSVQHRATHACVP